MIGSEGSFPLISLPYANIVISPTDIKFCEILGILKGVDKVGDEGWWITVLFGDVVQSAVILNWAEPSVLFLDEEEGGSHWGIRHANPTSTKVLFGKFIELGALFMRESIKLTLERSVSSLNQLDCMIPRSGWWQLIELFLVKNVAIVLEIRREVFFNSFLSFSLPFFFYCHLLRRSVMSTNV